MRPSIGFRGSDALSVGAALLVILHLSTAFQCELDNPYNCSCIQSDDYELECPRLVDGDDLRLLTVKISWDTKNTSSEVSCRINATASDFRLLDGINITSLEKVHFKSCPLPRVPFRQVFQLQNPLDLIELGFFGRDQSENLTFQLEGLTNLATLDISDNSFKNISAETFEAVPNLTSLVLRSNRFTTITKEALDKVPKLTSLELGKNRITSLSPGVFSSLTSLRRLLLYRNELGNASLTADVFQGLANVDILDLGGNNIVSLPGDVFKYLVKLRELNLSNNKFESLPEGLFKTTPLLESFKLFGNKASNLIIPAGLFENLSALQQINMDGCNIEALPENIFRGASAIVSISLKGNRLKELPATIFKDTVNLQNLYLQENKIGELHSEVFSTLSELQTLDLSQNQIVNISEGVFWKTAKLETLNIPNNGLMNFDKRAFQIDTCKIHTIDLSNNLLTFQSDNGFNNSPLSNCKELIEIDLSNNSITTIFQDWKFSIPSIQKINLRSNKLTELNLADNGFRSATIDVTNNSISVVYLNSKEFSLEELLEISGVSAPSTVKVLLDENPISCDCNSYDLLRYFEHKLIPKVYEKLDLKADNLKCASPRALKDKPITSVLSKDVTCPLTPQPYSAPCPASCECKERKEDQALIIQCGGAHLTSAPDMLPVSENANHTELNISHNAITSLPLLTQPGYENVTKLFASHNRISRLNISSLPSKLQVLELHNNNLTMLQPRVVDYITNLTHLSSLTLHNNSWDCQCVSLHFVNFVQAKYQKIRDFRDITCADGRSVSNLTASGICPNVGAILWVLVVGAICIIICGLVIAYYRYQQEIKVWLFAHRMCLWWVTEQELDRDKRYDAFICFSHKDQAFVDDELIPNLENGSNPFKLCIHTRDFIPGEWITNQIISAVENSRRTIIVLSPNFVESEWGRMEFRTAHAQAMSEGRARVIVILYGDVGPTEKLEPELRAYLNMNTYVKWGDPWFWDKLRYALPHPPELLKNNPAMAFVRQASLRRKPLEDRLELICDPNCPSVISPNSAENDDTAINNEKNAKLNENGKHTQPKAVPAS